MMKKILIIALCVLFTASCSDDILDLTPKDRVSEGSVWEDESLIQAYQTGLYNCILHGFNIHMPSKATDEAYVNINWGIGIMQYGTYNADNITGVADTDWTGGGGLYYWNTAFKYIRKMNLFLDKMENGGFEFDSKARLVAETKFLRGYLYFLLLERFGGVPIIEQTYSFGEDITFTRNTVDECVAFIEKNLTEAIPDLPKKINSTDANFGRASQDVCQALRSRMYLYAASKLFNPSDDKAKWQKAADAAEALLSSGYELYPDYQTCFNMASGSENKEFIFTRNFATGARHQAPVHNLNRRYGAYGGWWASNGPTQNLVDDYDMINGEPAFIYQGGVKMINPSSGYDPQNPYANRDPRFDATVIHDESTYHGDMMEMWVASNGETWGYDSYKQSGDNPRSNYVLKKFMPGVDTPISWQYDYTIPWPIFRLAEIYLNYAEAKFELGDEATCRKYINFVRDRVGMPEIPSTVTGEDLRDRLYNERRIEFAFEDHRFWDVRRWKIASDVESRPIMGMDIIKDIDTGVKTYTPVQLCQRIFKERMHLLPIATDEIRKNNGTLQQNPGW